MKAIKHTVLESTGASKDVLDTATLRIDEGPFKGITFRFQNVNIIEDEKNDELKFDFNFAIVNLPPAEAPYYDERATRLELEEDDDFKKTVACIGMMHVHNIVNKGETT